jgi:hypothetical protein
MADNRTKRDDPPRTGSNRSTSASGRARSGAQRGVINRAVELAYGVVDSHIEQGRRAAKRVQDGSYSAGNFDDDLKECLTRALKLSKEFAILGVDIVDAVRRMAGPRSGPGSPSANIAVEKKGKRQAEVKYDLRSSPDSFSPAVPPLHSADKTKEPLRDVRFVVKDGRSVLVVNVPDGHPPGVYNGAIVDHLTHEPRGFISVRVLEEDSD